MSNEETSEATEVQIKKPSNWEWIWPAIVGGIIFKLIGVVGGGVALFAYYLARKKFGALLSISISAIFGIAVDVVLTIVFLFVASVGEFSPSKKSLAALIVNPVSTREIKSAQNKDVVNHPAEQYQAQQQGNELEKVVNSAIIAYPFLDHQSPNANRPAIDAVIARRDIYLGKGYAPPDALTKAVNEIGPMYAAKQNEVGQSKKSTRQEKAPQTWVEMKEIRARGCNPSGVMTDEEMARCR